MSCQCIPYISIYIYAHALDLPDQPVSRGKPSSWPQARSPRKGVKTRNLKPETLKTLPHSESLHRGFF